MARIVRYNDENVREEYIRNDGKKVTLFTRALKDFQCNNRIVVSQRKHLDDFLRGTIIGRLEYGRSQLEEELGTAQSVISRLWQRFQDDGNVSRCYSTGHPRVTTPNEDRYFAVTAERNRRSTASDLSRQLSSATGTTVSRQTVYRRIGHIGLHWCAKINDEVEKLAYQLNEEAERTERPIRRLSKNHWEGRSVTSVAAEFGIAHSIISRLWRQLQTIGTAIRRFSSGRPRGTTPADDRYIVLQARRNRRHTAGEIARHTTQATGRPISRFTVARRLHGGGLFARRPVRCVPLTPAHRRRRSLWCREHRNRRDNERGRVLFIDDSRLSLSSDSHRILIWRERGSRNDPSNIIERDRRYGSAFPFLDDNAPCHRTVAAKQLLESEDIERTDWPARYPDLNPIEHVWDFLGRRLAARTLPPVTIRELRLALQDEWAAMPQQLIDTLILSMGRRCETCLAVRGDHIPY
ncbi:transposable element Tcb1 transposase [Trichonephila clavipes]|nr:transposable element Tcb1 transposase [Trichonephila clavipes]